MKFGLKENDIKYILKILENFPQIETALIFGSRAKGNYKLGSDIDIAIVGGDIDFDVIANVHYLLEEESPMPYMFDIVNYNKLENIKLKEHIDRVGITIYSKK